VSVGQEQAHRVAVGGDRFGAGVTLGDQPLGEERLKRRGDETHDNPCPICSRRSLAVYSSTSG